LPNHENDSTFTLFVGSAVPLLTSYSFSSLLRLTQPGFPFIGADMNLQLNTTRNNTKLSTRYRQNLKVHDIFGKICCKSTYSAAARVMENEIYTVIYFTIDDRTSSMKATASFCKAEQQIKKDMS
jgi:hypothetical protein